MTPLEYSILYFGIMTVSFVFQNTIFKQLINPLKSDKEQDKFYSKE